MLRELREKSYGPHIINVKSSVFANRIPAIIIAHFIYITICIYTGLRIVEATALNLEFIIAASILAESS